MGEFIIISAFTHGISRSWYFFRLGDLPKLGDIIKLGDLLKLGYLIKFGDWLKLGKLQISFRLFRIVINASMSINSHAINDHSYKIS